MSVTTTPADVQRVIAAKAARSAETARKHWEAQRRSDAAKRGYRGPLTRSEVAARVASA